MAEQWTFNPLVDGSSPSGGTSKFNFPEFFGSWFSRYPFKTNGLGKTDTRNSLRKADTRNYLTR